MDTLILCSNKYILLYTSIDTRTLYGKMEKKKTQRQSQWGQKSQFKYNNNMFIQIMFLIKRKYCFKLKNKSKKWNEKKNAKKTEENSLNYRRRWRDVYDKDIQKTLRWLQFHLIIPKVIVKCLSSSWMLSCAHTQTNKKWPCTDERHRNRIEEHEENDDKITSTAWTIEQCIIITNIFPDDSNFKNHR